MQSLSNLCCKNKKCRDYGKRKENNLAVCGWYGINNQIRLLYCRTCKSRFSEIQTTKPSRNKMESIKAENLFKDITESQDFVQLFESIPLL